MTISFIAPLLVSLLAAYAFLELLRKAIRKRKRTALANAYYRLVLHNKLSIEAVQVFSNRAIALDKGNRKLLLLDRNRPKGQETCISLLETATSTVIHETDRNSRCINRIWLVVKCKRTPRADRFCFYDAATDPAAHMILLSRKALHWQKKINHLCSGALNAEMEGVT